MTSPSDPEGSTGPRRAALVGLGLIGGSIGLALRSRGWHVTGRDQDPTAAEAALAAGVVDAVGEDPAAAVTFVATPVGETAGEVARVLAQEGLAADAAVSDVGGVKAAVVAAVDDPRFVGGHPMAGSEQVGLEGADPTLFVGATWVLTPTAVTDAGAYARVRAVAASLGAEVLSLSPEHHDALVALVSHVPHLAAATLMNLADRRAEEHAALLRLAAGGFRDMTRVAAGSRGSGPTSASRTPRPSWTASTRSSRSSAGCASRWPPTTGAGSSPPWAGPLPPAAPCPRLRCGPSGSWSSGCRCPTGPACWRRSRPPPGTSA